jgi:uncharacterized pyridoxamine 5'-phosphate oxidase family protein
LSYYHTIAAQHKNIIIEEVWMGNALQFLKASGVFHIATVDGGKGRVRPFAFCMKWNNAFYMCTNKTKDVYKQMVQNPDIEISAVGQNGTWLRIRGKVAMDDNRTSKAQAFVESPDLLKFYTKGADDDIFVTFYFTEAVATLSSFTEPPKQIPLV